MLVATRLAARHRRHNPPPQGNFFPRRFSPCSIRPNQTSSCLSWTMARPGTILRPLLSRLLRENARVRLVRQNNLEAPRRVKRPLAQARGEFFACSSTATISSGCLELPATQLAILAEDSDARDLVSSNAIKLGGPADCRPLKPVAATRQPISIAPHPSSELKTHSPLSAFRRRLIERTGGFDCP